MSDMVHTMANHVKVLNELMREKASAEQVTARFKELGWPIEDPPFRGIVATACRNCRKSNVLTPEEGGCNCE